MLIIQWCVIHDVLSFFKNSVDQIDLLFNFQSLIPALIGCSTFLSIKWPCANLLCPIWGLFSLTSYCLLLWWVFSPFFDTGLMLQTILISSLVDLKYLYSSCISKILCSEPNYAPSVCCMNARLELIPQFNDLTINVIEIAALA